MMRAIRSVAELRKFIRLELQKKDYFDSVMEKLAKR